MTKSKRKGDRRQSEKQAVVRDLPPQVEALYDPAKRPKPKRQPVKMELPPHIAAKFEQVRQDWARGLGTGGPAILDYKVEVKCERDFSEWRMHVAANKMGDYRGTVAIPLRLDRAHPFHDSDDIVRFEALVEAALKQCMALLTRLPMPIEVVRLNRALTLWPDHILDYPERVTTRVPLSTREVAFMDAVLEWFLLIDDRYTRRVVAARIAGRSVRETAATMEDRPSKSALQRIYFRGLNRIATALLIGATVVKPPSAS